jgi:hypothetical protein
MRCERCHGKGYFEEYYTCSDCNGSGITSCCDTAGSQQEMSPAVQKSMKRFEEGLAARRAREVGEVSMKKVGDYVSESVKIQGTYISDKDQYIFAHNSDAYIIWDKETGQIVWVGEEGKLGKNGYSDCWETALDLNDNLLEQEMRYSIIACNRIDDVGPPFPSKIGTCTKCKNSIYISNSTPIINNAIYMCMGCINWDKVTLIKDLTEEQLQDIDEAEINRKLGG